MKKAFVLLALVGVLFFGCDNGSTNGGTTPTILRAVSVDQKVITLETIDGTRHARSLEQGNTYVLKYTMANGVSGNTTTFEPTITIIVTVQNINNNKITFKPIDPPGSDFIATVNANGQLTNIEDLPGVMGGILFPYEYSPSGIQGAWFGRSIKEKDGIEEIKRNSFVINGDNFTMLHYNETKKTPEQPQIATINVTGDKIKISNLQGWDFDKKEFVDGTWSGGDEFTFEMPDDDTLFIVGDGYYTRVK